MAEDEKNKGVLDQAFSDLADEFSESAKGSGASLGRSAKFLAGAVEIVVTSPLLIPKGYMAIVDKMKPLLDEKIRKIPDDKLIEPDLSIAGPAIEAMRFTIEDVVIANLFANLLACSMNSDFKSQTHHSFVEVIKQLSPGEAQILEFLANSKDQPIVDLKAITTKKHDYREKIRNASNIGENCGIENLAVMQIYIDNLCRLRLCEIPSGVSLSNDKLYEPIEQSEAMKAHVQEIEKDGFTPEFERKALVLTDYGRVFCRVCIKNK